MTQLLRIPLDGTDGPSCYVDGDNGRWFVAGPDAALDDVANPALVTGDTLSGACRQSGPGGATGGPPSRSALRHVWLYTNTDCNLRCRHCLLPEHDTRPPLKDLLRRLEDALARGARTIFLTGGEPFFRDDIETVLAAAAAKTQTVVLTNGTLITPKRLAVLDELGAGEWRQNLSFQVSVDGDCHAHEAIRGAGTFELAMRGIQTLVDWGRPPTISTAVTRLNIGAVEAVTAMCGSMGLAAHHLFLPHRAGRLGDEEKLVPSSAELVEVLRRCRIVAGQKNVILDNDAALLARVHRPGRRFVSCHGGHEMVAIGPDGTVYPCPSLVGHKETGCSGDAGVSAALESAELAAFREHHAECRGECRACHVRAFCGGGCAAYSYWTGRRYDAPEPYCDIYRSVIEDHLRMEATRLLEQAGTLGTADVLWPDGAAPGSETDIARFDCA